MRGRTPFVVAVAGFIGACVAPSESRVADAVGPVRQPALHRVPEVHEVHAAVAGVTGVVTVVTAATATTASTDCPAGMVLVDGAYCPEVRQTCLVWADPPSRPFARCARFAPSTCAAARTHKRFCVDRDEYVAPGDSLPLGDASWVKARQVCEGQGKRLCKETEWEFACEGEEMLPYPTGYDRDAKACNVDRGDLVDPATRRLRDKREPPSEVDRCTSPFGARSMIGNVDEWVWRDRTGGPWRSALKGGWWMPARDRCRPATTVHGESFHDVQTGVRCCADVR